MSFLRIDTHSHVVPPEYAEWLRGKGVLAGGLPIPSWDADTTLALMDRHQIATAVLSVSTPGVHLDDGADARAMARHVNEYTAQMVRDHPGRFGFFATLPLPDVDGALTELDRAFETLGADGVVLLANHRGVYLGDPRFDAVFDELQRRQASSSCTRRSCRDSTRSTASRRSSPTSCSTPRERPSTSPAPAPLNAVPT
jgi:predicted TIM-barrel fold metal-dependent hydrolase